MPQVQVEGAVREEFIVLGTHEHSNAQVLECKVFFSQDPNDFDILYRLSGSSTYYDKKPPLKKVPYMQRWINRSQKR